MAIKNTRPVRPTRPRNPSRPTRIPDDFSAFTEYCGYKIPKSDGLGSGSQKGQTRPQTNPCPTLSLVSPFSRLLSSQSPPSSSPPISVAAPTTPPVPQTATTTTTAATTHLDAWLKLNGLCPVCEKKFFPIA